MKNQTQTLRRMGAHVKMNILQTFTIEHENGQLLKHVKQGRSVANVVAW